MSFAIVGKNTVKVMIPENERTKDGNNDSPMEDFNSSSSKKEGESSSTEDKEVEKIVFINDQKGSGFRRRSSSPRSEAEMDTNMFHLPAKIRKEIERTL